MAEERLPLLRGRVTRVDTYESPAGGGGKPVKLPSPQPEAHRKRLSRQLDAIDQHVQLRPENARDEIASREIVAVRPTPGTELVADQLDDTKADARLIGVAETGGTSLDDQ